MRILVGFLLVFASFQVAAQEFIIKGKVLDNANKQPLVGAKIIVNQTIKTLSDLDGNYSIKVNDGGEHKMVVSMLLFATESYTITINKSITTFDIFMGVSQELDEVKVVGNIAMDRKTPVAVTTLDKRQIDEELGSQDITMVLNSKPGVMATQQGGGDGDSRITIRGFDQRNVGVMIDGVPVNDMENGAVYWSNWFGLDAITQQIQLQRGLGATKLAMPSVGGTMNILTQSTAGKKEFKVQQEYGSGNFLRTSASYKSGTLKNGWGVLASASYKKGNGWVDGLETEGGFFYLKVQKKTGNHVTALSTFGAPQRHGQRSFNQPISYWNSQYAQQLGIDTTGAENWGRRHNEHFGYVTNGSGKKEVKSERENFYHKPQITLKDFWQVNKRLAWSNMAYVSIGRGGGSRLQNSGAIIYDSLGQIDWDAIRFGNQNKTFAGQVIGTTADLQYHPTELKSSQIQTASINNHFWVGGISQIDFKLNKYWTFAAGLDYRNYRGAHYVEIVDLIGGDYWVNNANQNDANVRKRVGDKVGWQPFHNHRDGLVQWAGGFGQAEYSKGRWTAFANVSFVGNGYRGIDYFEKKEYHDGDSIIYVGINDTINYQGKTLTNDSPELKYNDTGWKWLTGGTYKAGANFNITEKSNFFVNLGYLDRTPQFSNVIDNNTNQFFVEILNEKITAFELGYGYRSRKLSINTNGYYTNWQNKPFPFGVLVPDPQDPATFVRANVNGMDALHMGIEIDAAYTPVKNLTIEAMASIGDWTWQSSETINVVGTEFTFDAKGVHVGDAAQSTYALSLRYAPIKRSYVKLKYVYFDRYYSNFDPFSLTGVNGGRESWKIPSYGMLSAHFGYSFKMGKTSPTLLHLRGNIFNVLNTFFISDARNNQNGSGYDASSAGVFVGQGTTFNVSLGLDF